MTIDVFPPLVVIPDDQWEFIEPPYAGAQTLKANIAGTHVTTDNTDVTLVLPLLRPDGSALVDGDKVVFAHKPNPATTNAVTIGPQGAHTFDGVAATKTIHPAYYVKYTFLFKANDWEITNPLYIGGAGSGPTDPSVEIAALTTRVTTLEARPDAGEVIGSAATMAELLALRDASAVASTDDRYYLTADEVGTGTTENPQFARGEYTQLGDGSLTLRVPFATPPSANNVIDNYAAARLRSDLVLEDKYEIKSRDTFGDGGEGEFYAVTAGALVDNDGTLLLTATAGVALKRIYTGSKHLSWFGGGAGYLNPGALGPDNYQALVNAIDADDGSTTPIVFYKYQNSVYINRGKRYFSDTIELKGKVEIHGDMPHTVSYTAINQLFFAAGKTGFNVNRYNTLGDTVEGTPTTGADASVIRDLSINSLGGPSSGNTPLGGNGINLRARAYISGVEVKNFPLDGIRVVAVAVGPTPDNAGNANGFSIENCRLLENDRAGLYVDGPDANAGNVKDVDSSANGQYGIYDSSFLGNTYIGCHTASNGTQIQTKGYNSIVFHLGTRYVAHPDATEAQYIATEPGTNNNIWRDDGAGTVHPSIPQWDGALPVGTYKAGGPYVASNPNASSVFTGCYSESGQAASWIKPPSIVIGGLHGSRIHGGGVQHYGKNISSHSVIPNSEIDTGDGQSLELMGVQNMFARFYLNPTDWMTLAQYFTAWKTIQPYSWKGLGTGSNINVIASDTSPINCAKPGGLSPGAVLLGPEVYIGQSNNGRRVGYAQEMPLNGRYAKGDVIFNNGVINTDVAGWHCTASSSTDGTTTTATWKEFGGTVVKTSTRTLTSLAANTPTDVVPVPADGITKITGYDIFASDDLHLKDFEVRKPAAGDKITISSTSAHTDLRIEFTGT